MYTTSRYRDESGVALLTALFASLVLGGLVVIFVSNAVSQSRASYASQTFEQTLHVAETATDVAFARLAEDRRYFTTNVPVAGDERQWAINQADLAVGAACENAVRVGQGDAIPVVPQRSGWMDATMVYGVGYLPDCISRQQIRVVKMELVSQPVEVMSAPSGILSGGNVKLQMNVKVTGGVHANGRLDYGGSSGAIDVASAGTCGTGAAAISCQTVPLVDVVALTAREFWDRRTNPSIDLSVPWYDLCPDGKVRRPAEDDEEPCLGGEVPRPTGWSFSAPTWTHSGNSMPNGIYYSYRTNVTVANNPQSGRVTMIAEADVEKLRAGTGTLAGGSVTIQSNPKFTPVWPGVGIVTDVDIVVQQNGAFDGTQAMMYSREQIRWNQNHKTSGVFFVACDESRGSDWSVANPTARSCPAPNATGTMNSTPGSPIHTNPTETISLQNMEIAFADQGSTLIPGSDDLAIARWEELR